MQNIEINRITERKKINKMFHLLCVTKLWQLVIARTGSATQRLFHLRPSLSIIFTRRVRKGVKCNLPSAMRLHTLQKRQGCAGRCLLRFGITIPPAHTEVKT